MKKNFGIALILVLALFVTGCSSLFSKNKENSVQVLETDQQILEEVVYEEGAKNFEGARNFVLISEESEAEYSINEILRGVPTLVVGKSQALSGNILAQPENNFEIIGGEIKLDAKSFKTAISARDNNVANLILRANEPGNEFIIFKPSAISGLEEELVLNQDLEVEITGDLTIAGITQSMNFVGTVNWSDENNLSGIITADLTYANFGLALPDFDFFSDVDEIAKLKINFKAGANN